MKTPSHRYSRWLTGVLMALLLIPGPFAGAQPAAAAGGPADQRQLSELGPGDQISLQVYGQPDMTSTVYIGDDGTVSMPLAGAVPVAGLTPVQAARRIEKALKDGQYLVDPHVTILILQARSQRVSVLGEVKTPGRYPIDPNTSIFDLLAEAGGVAETAADVADVQRTEADGTVRHFSINLHGTGGQQDPAQETLQPGDSVFIPRAEQFYVYGEVARPDMYRLESGMTVIQAISRAGGITPRGSEHRIELKRLGPDGKYIVRKARPDELLQPNDVLRVKESIF